MPEPFCNRQTSSVAGTKDAANSMIRASDQTDSRPATPFAHVGPSGWPFMTQSRTGRLDSEAACKPAR